MAKGDTATKGKDAAQGGGGAAIPVSADTLAEFAKRITDLDAKIAAASGSDAQAKRAWIDSLIAQNQAEVDGYVNSLIEQLGNIDLPILVGLVTRLEERVKSDLEPRVTAYVDEEFPKSQTDTQEDVGQLRETRKELLVQFRALREVLKTFKIDTDHIPEPRRGGGGRPAGSGGGGGASAKSGNNKEGYRYLMDGKPRPPSQNSFSSLAFYATNGCPAKVLEQQGLSPEEAKQKAESKKWGAPQLKTYLQQEGVNFGQDDTWEVTLPNGTKIGARRFTEQDKIELKLVDDANQVTTQDGDGAAPPSITDPAATPGASPVPAGAQA